LNLAVIPARGGSKRIPGKNIRDFHAKPMIAWSIERALGSGLFDDVIVSTDDVAIADVATRFGASVPWTRPDHLADDHSTTADVMQHAVSEIHAAGQRPDLVCCIYATAPFVRSEDLATGQKLISASENDYCLSVTEFEFPIQRALQLDTHKQITAMYPEHIPQRSQDLEPAFHDAGQFYWGTPEAWLEQKPIFAGRSLAVVLPSWRVQDIDTEDDWIRAERLFEHLNRD